jgi:hypothetical protein
LQVSADPIAVPLHACNAWLTIPQACLKLVPLYAMTNDMDGDQFASFTKPNNFVAQILLAHFWMLTYLLEERVLGPSRPFALRREVLLHWVGKALQGLPQSHKQYALWPLGMVGCQGVV